MQLRPGVSRLEKGCQEWAVDEVKVIRISYGGVHTEIKNMLFGEEDHVL